MGNHDFVLSSPGGLTSRAQAFLRAQSHRAPFDKGLVGEQLRGRLRAVYGSSDEQFVGLLDMVQRRYGGLTYWSGYFESSVRFSPTCEPESADEQLEILYAVETGGPTGASVRWDGMVAVGFDQAEVAEFPTLDSVIECDSMFDLAGKLPIAHRFYVGGDFMEVVERIMSDVPLGLRLVPEAGGAHTYWFAGGAANVFLCSTWSELGLPLPPLLNVWCSEPDIAGNVERLAK